MVERKTLAVTGMSCTGCEQNVENALQNVEGVRKVEADHNAETVEIIVDDEATDDKLAQAVHDAGYDVAG